MNIVYNNDTLYVDLNNIGSNLEMNELKNQVFNILDYYDIENIVLNIVSSNKNQILLDNFIKAYHKKYKGNIRVE